jgi:hypothetical protein
VYYGNIRTFRLEVIRPLIKNGDGPPLELVSHCIIIPPDISQERPFNLFEDAIKIFKRRCMLHSPFDEIGRHLILRFLVVSALLPRQTKTADDPTATVRIIADVKYERALNLSDANANKLPRLMRTVITFLDLFAQSHIHADLDKAITVYEAAVRLTLDGHQSQAELLGRLGVALLLRI